MTILKKIKNYLFSIYQHLIYMSVDMDEDRLSREIIIFKNNTIDETHSNLNMIYTIDGEIEFTLSSKNPQIKLPDAFCKPDSGSAIGKLKTVFYFETNYIYKISTWRYDLYNVYIIKATHNSKTMNIIYDLEIKNVEIKF